MTCAYLVVPLYHVQCFPRYQLCFDHRYLKMVPQISDFMTDFVSPVNRFCFTRYQILFHQISDFVFQDIRFCFPRYLL